jgi:hypothetical protein
MKISHRWSLPLLAAVMSACEPVTGPHAHEPGELSFASAQAALHIAASGTFSQTGITSLVVEAAGPNTILDQTSVGSVTGTLSGSYEDELKVVIHPNGRFNAHFNITCQCTVEGQSGTLYLVAWDQGEIASPTTASFKGRAVITGGTGGLAKLRGVLEIEGTVDLPTGLSTYTYAGMIH